MNIEVISSTKTKMEFKLPDVEHTLCNALKIKLTELPDVKIATYAVRHPLVGVPQFFIETTSKTTPVKALQAAAKALKADFAKLEKSAKKEL